MTATTDVVISEKSMLELASVEFSGTAVSRMSVMRMTESLVHVNASGLDHFAPARGFGLDAFGEFGRCVGDGDKAEGVEFFLHFGVGGHFHDGLVPSVDDRLRRAGRRQNAGQRVAFEARHALFAVGW